MVRSVATRVSGFIAFICLAILLLAVPPSAHADTVGSAVGTVKDPTGAIVQGARLTLKSLTTNAVFTAVSSESGAFRFESLVPDRYSLTAESAGFKRSIVSDVIVQIDQATTLNVTLSPGDVNQVIDVVAGAPLVETEQNTISNVIDRQTIATMPLNSRNFTDLALLTPGATPSAAGSQVSGFNVAGARTQSNDYLIDGISNIDTQVNSGLTSFRINDAVQEFSVQTSVPTAEFGRGQGAQVNAVIRSGSNAFHGSAFDYFRNTILNATDYFAKHAGGTILKPVLIRNQFGATFGGPIWRDKTFFFLSYEGFRQIAPSVANSLVPTDAQRASVTDPISKALLAYFPLAQGPIVNGSNYTSPVRNVLNDDTGLVRVDHNLTEKDRLSGHFITYNGRSISGGATPLSGGSGNTPLSKSVFLEENHTFSPTILNTLRFGYSFNQTNFVVQDFGSNAQTIFASGGAPLPGVTNGVTNPQDSGIPTITISGGFARLGAATNLPQGRKTRTYEIYDTLSASSLFGSTKHAFKAGYHVRREDARRFLDSNARGSFTFTSPSTSTLTSAQASFNDFASGAVFSSSFRTGRTIAHYRRYPMDMFVQDQWKILPNLTLNLGIRYELPSAIYELDGRGSNFLPGQGVTLLGTNQVLDIDTTKAGPSSLVLTPGGITLTKSGQLEVARKNFAPVVGFAWSPYRGTDNTTVRGGFRIGYDDIFNNIPANQSLNPPFTLVTSQTAGVTQKSRFSYATGFDQNVPLVKNVGKQGPGTPTVGLLGFNAMDPHIRSAYNYAYSLSVEQKINDRIGVELDYIGSTGRKLGVYLDANQPAVIRVDPTLRGSQPPNQQVFPYNHFSSISQGKGAVNSNYNGAIAVLKYRGRNGMAAQASYTWSHSLDYSSAYFGSTGDLSFPSDSTNLKAEYGNSAFDERHRLVAYYSIPLPFGPGRKFLDSSNIFVREAVEGWTVSGITEVQSGLPFTVYLNGIDYSGFNQFADRPNINPGVPIAQNNKNPDAAFNFSKLFLPGATPGGAKPSPFTLIGAGQVGNERRNQYYGPGLVNFDVSASKDFPIFERVKLQFRADLFNVFNHTNFSNPNGSSNSSTFGRITSTVASSTGNGFGGVRLAQFSLRLNF